MPKTFKLRILLFSIWSSAISAVTFRSYLRTPLGQIDDHEYPYYQLLNPSKSWTSAVSDGFTRGWTEFVDQSRFRPVYHIGRAWFVTVIGQDELPRYLVRLVILAVTLCLLGIIVAELCRHFGGTEQLAILLGMSATLPFTALLPWPDVIGRLGPPDSFAWAGVVLFAAFLLLQTKLEHYSASLLLSSSIFLVGHRENYAVLAPLAIGSILFFRSKASMQRRASAWIALTIAIVGTLSVVMALSLQSGMDYYGNERGLRSLFSGMNSFRGSNLFTLYSIALALLTFVTPKRYLRFTAWLNLILTVAMVSEYSIYQSALLVYPRYSMITKAIVACAWICAVVIGVSRLIVWLMSKSNASARWQVFAESFLGAAIFAGVLVVLLPNLGAQREMSVAQRRAAVGYQMTLDQLEGAVQYEAKETLILVDRSSVGFREFDLQERSVSILRFLAYRLGESKVSLADIASLPSDLSTPGVRSTVSCILMGLDDGFPIPLFCGHTHFLY